MAHDDRWGTYLPGGNLLHDAVGAEDFYKLSVRGARCSRAVERLMNRIEPLGNAIFSLPSAAVRGDAAVALTMGRYAPAC